MVNGSTAAPRGVLTFSYTRDLASGDFIPSVSVLSNLGTIQTLVGASLNQLQDTDLGLVSAIALGQDGGTTSTVLAIDTVAGRPI